MTMKVSQYLFSCKFVCVNAVLMALFVGQVMSKICFGSSCNVHSVCHNYCQHDGACVVTVDDDMWESTCDCTIGFYGETCTRNNLLDVWERRVWSDSIFTLPEAMRYSQVALDMLKDHLKHEFQLQASSVSFNNVLELVADGVDKKMKRKDDIFPFVEVYADGLTYIITILQMKGCAIGQVINCTINHIQFESILTKAEANLIRITNLWLETDDGQGIQKTVDKRDILSLTVLKDKGKNLPFEFFTKYGYMKLPYFETFQDTIGSAVVAVNVLTYIQSPYKYVNNTDATTSSTVKVVITDKKGKQLKLRDLDDPVDMAVDMTKIFASSHTWIKPEILDDGSSMVVAYVNETNEAYSVEFKLKSVLECTIYGIFGYTKPSVFNRAISIKTKGIKKILEIEPVDQPVFFNDSILQITVYNTKYSSGGYLDPLVLTLSCQDDVARRRRRDLSEYMGHFYRVQILSVVNLKGTKWDTSAGSKISRAEGNVAVFKSTFFGTFGSDALFSPPTPINFVDIFLNFSEKLQQTPQVLAAEVFLIIFFIAIVIPLRRADQKDRLLWEYLPLVDNEPDDKVQYCLAIFTSIRSSKILSSTVFFTLNGKKATTNARMVKTDSRENFQSGTCCNFLLTTEEYLGQLVSLTVWHDNTGKNPDWKLSKIVVTDLTTNERYAFMCGEWLSLKFKDGKTYRTLVPATPQIINGQVVFTELSLRGFFDDHLWFSISKRPNYSRFTRVQRMWSLVALLFLSMVTSAMWYNSEPSEEKQITTGTVQRSVTLGPFKLNLKQIYVGLMSSIITVIPSIIIISLFRNRKLKTDSSEDIRRTGGKLPWWTIFIAYFLIVAAIVGGGFFTFLYSLQFGYGKTNDWLLSFVFGTAEGAFMMDPLKVLFVATLFGICCKKSTNVLSECAEENHLKTAYVSDYIKRREIAYYPCPNTAVDQEKINKQRKEVQLDSKLKKISKSWVLTFLYIFLLAIICAHNTVTEAFRQNSYLKSSIKDSFLANTTDDIYLWMQRYMLTQIWPKWYSNLALRTAYEQRFINDEYSYRISKSPLRQVRSHNCSPLEEMKSSVSKCTSDYSIETEDKTNYCKGWLPFQTENTTCYDEYDPIDNSFIYQSAEVTNTLTYIGEFAMYGGGGYTIDLGPKQSLVEQYIENLKNLSWIDGKTRAVFFETNTFNANTRLFSHLKIVFEISEYGSIYMTTRVKSLNLYPYVTSMDYIILGCQLIFVFIIIMRIVFFAVYIFKKRSACFRTFSSWIIALDLFLSLIAVIFYILRIDTTIKAINDIIESRGSYVSLEHVELYDMVYRTALGLVFFFGILRLLQPLTINYHFFILQKSLAKARYDIFMSMILIIFALVSFGSYLFLSLGRYSENFKDLYSSIISLLRMLLAMISFRLNPNLDSVESRIVTGLFFFSISIIGVNLFIAILFGHFADVHAMQSKLKSKTGNEVLDDEVFNFELNDHLWKQMKRIKHIFSEPKIESQGISFPEDILHKLEILNQHVTLKCKDEYRFMRVIPCLVYLTNAMSWSMYMAMKTAADYSEENGLRYRFFNPNEDHPRLTVHFPEANLSDAPDIQCNNVAHRYFSLSSEIRRLLLFAKTRIYEFKLPNDRPFQMKVNDITKRITIIEVDDELVSDEDYLVCSFDDRQSWFRYAIRPREDKFCCTLPKLPTYCFVIGKLGQIQVNRDTICCFPDIEYHQIRKEGNSIFLHADKRIRISFPPGSVQNNCDIYVMMDLPKKQICPFVHVLVKEDINDPVEISLPIVYKGLQASKYGHKNTEKLIVVREGEKEWMVLNSVLKLDAAGFTFETIKIQSNVPTTFGLKEAVLPWVENPFDKLDTKILKTINMVSRYNCVALKWSEIAHNLDIEFPSTFGGRETDSYEICNNETPDGNPNPRQMSFTFRRVIDIPISAQEKCLYIFSAWYRMYPLGIVVSSFRKVLEDCNLHFIAEQLGQRL